MERIPEQYNEQSLSDAGLEETPEIAIEATADIDDNGELKEESQEITEETESPDVAQTEEEVNVTATDENQVVSQPDSVAVETVESRVDSHINEENPSYPMASDSVLSLESDSRGATHKWLYVCFTIFLMALSYAAGHYQVLSGFDIALYPEHLDEGTAAMEVGQPAPLEMQAPAECTDTLLTDTLTTDSVETATDTIAKPEPVVKEEDPAEIAKYFPQVPGGEYWIVGDAGRVHYMQVGETLYKIAKQELGDRELVRYLIVFNDFEDPNIIHTGDKIRIPKLVKKTPVNR
jgi:nucleoid-associated protein YgaU